MKSAKNFRSGMLSMVFWMIAVIVGSGCKLDMAARMGAGYFSRAFDALLTILGPESANNAGAQTSFIPLRTLGIPESAVMAMLVGAMTIHNIEPGPQVVTSNPELRCCCRAAIRGRSRILRFRHSC